jgi:Holliday junction resolvase RusA-like endonuclease
VRKVSLGKTWTNSQPETKQNENAFELNYSRKIFIFDVVPVGAVRMTQSDKWKTNPLHKDPNKRQRPEVTRYFNFKDIVRQQAKDLNYILGDTLEVIFCVPMPQSWSTKKKERMNKLPVKTRPDIDNYVKAFADAICIEDGNIWFVKAEKRYAFQGSIIIYQ